MKTALTIKNKTGGVRGVLTANKVASLVLLLVIFVVLGLVPTMTQGYAVTLLTDVLRYIVLAVAWMIFSAKAMSGHFSAS